MLTNPGGRDPLGLSRVGQRLTDLLLPGIITQTDRARYYAIYCWILWHIQREEKPESWPIFASAFQRREAAVALSTMIVDENASPVGKLGTWLGVRRDICYSGESAGVGHLVI